MDALKAVVLPSLTPKQCCSQELQQNRATKNQEDSQHPMRNSRMGPTKNEPDQNKKMPPWSATVVTTAIAAVKTRAAAAPAAASG